MKMSFKGRTAVITGGTRGIGKAVCDILLKNGCNVIGTGKQTLDLSDKRSVKAFEHQLKGLRSIDILVNNAGINVIEPIDKISMKNWNDIIQVNLTGAMLMIRAVAPYMKKQKSGKIVNVSSIWGIISKEGRAAYSASKAGLLGLTKAAALDLAPYNIMVNAVCPGFTMTDLTKSTLSESEISALSKKVPLGRFADPQEIAQAVVFLCSDLNNYITGQAIRVDGGFAIA